MKFWPTAADLSLHTWEALWVALPAALLPAGAVIIWALFFRKPGRRKSRRRRRRRSANNPAINRTQGASAAFAPEKTPREPKS